MGKAVISTAALYLTDDRIALGAQGQENCRRAAIHSQISTVSTILHISSVTLERDQRLVVAANVTLLGIFDPRAYED